MPDQTMQQVIRKTASQIPGTSIAVAGLSLAIFAFESNRMASFQSVPSASSFSFVSMLATVIALGLLGALYLARPSFRIHRHPAIGFLIAGTLSASLLCMAGTMGAPSSQAYLLASIISAIAKSLLLLCWMEILYAYRSRQCATIVALAIAVTGALNAFSALVKQDAALILIAMVPLLSMACLYWLKDKQEAFDVPSILSRDSDFGKRKDVLKAPSQFSRGSYLIFLMPLACFTFAFGFIHYAWIPLQDGGNASMAIQLAAASGTVLAGVVLLLLVSHFWGARKLELYGLFVLFLLGITLYVTTILQGMMPGLYIIPLNIAQKITLFLVVMAPFLVPATHSSLSVATASSALYALGRGASTIAATLLDPSIYSISVALAAVLAALVIVIGIVMNGKPESETRQEQQMGDELLDPGNKAAEPHKAALSPQEATAETYEGLREADKENLIAENRAEAAAAQVKTEGGSEAEAERVLAACDAVARRHGLTNREREILYLLAQGMNASTIAEELTVSTSTVKTHMRNVYAKLEIHTQNELLLMVHRR